MKREALMPDLQEAANSKTVSAVWLTGENESTPVTPTDLFYSQEHGFCIQEYVATDGSIRVSNLFVPEGMASPKWHIKPDAGGGKYREEQVALSGIGWLRIYDVDGNLQAEHRLDATNQGANQCPVIVRPGDVFQVEADQIQDRRMQQLGLVAGVTVCAIFRDVPFDIQFEEKLA